MLNIGAIATAAQRVVRENVGNNLGVAFSVHETPRNTARFHGIAAPPGLLEISYEAEVTRDAVDCPATEACFECPLIDLPHEVVRFLYPSRYCESDKLVRLAAKEFGGLPPGHERVAGVCNWIYRNIDYVPGITDAHTSAVECLTLRAGVCRDFAHLGIAFCRAMGIPARYASCYVHGLPVPDFHAVFEVWLGSRWWYYDATRLAPQQGFIWLGSGHDAADSSVSTMSASVRLEAMEIVVEKATAEAIEYSRGPVAF